MNLNVVEINYKNFKMLQKKFKQSMRVYKTLIKYQKN